MKLYSEPIYICNCHHLGLKKSLLQLNCGFLIYCTTYREVKCPISNKGDPSYINLDNQRRFTENAKKRGVNRLSSYCRNEKKTIWVSYYLTSGIQDFRTIGHSDLRTIGPSDYQTFGILDLQTIGPSDYWTFGLSDRHPIKTFPTIFWYTRVNTYYLGPQYAIF